MEDKLLTRYYHGLYDIEDAKSIMSEGLRVGSSVADKRGQASDYPIIFEFADLPVSAVSYRSGDYHTQYSDKPAIPVAIYVNPKIWTKGIRDIDTVEKELIAELNKLEGYGVSPVDLVKMDEYIRQKNYPIAARLMEELDKSSELEMKEGKGASVIGGEEKFEIIKQTFPDIPVYRAFIDEEGGVDLEVSRGEKEYIPKPSTFVPPPITNKIKILEDLYGIVVDTEDEADKELKEMEKQRYERRKYGYVRKNNPGIKRI